MPASTMEWVGLHTHTNANGQVITAPMPTHVEVGVFIKSIQSSLRKRMGTDPSQDDRLRGQQLRRSRQPQESAAVLYQILTKQDDA